MTNMLGGDFDKAEFEFHFEWMGFNLNILQGKEYTNEQGVKGCRKYCGTISPNGSNGYSRNLNYPFGEPVLTNWSETPLSFSNMGKFMYEYWRKHYKEDVMRHCISKLAEEKKISFDDAIKHIQKKNIPCFYRPDGYNLPTI